MGSFTCPLSGWSRFLTSFCKVSDWTNTSSKVKVKQWGGSWSPVRSVRGLWVSHLSGYYAEGAKPIPFILILLNCQATDIFLSGWWEMLSHYQRAHLRSSWPPVSLPGAKEAIYLLVGLVIKYPGVRFLSHVPKTSLKKPQVRRTLLISLPPALWKLLQTTANNSSKHPVRVTSHD